MIDQSSNKPWHQRAATLSFETRPFMDGEYQPSKSGDVLHTVNPATGSQLATFSDGNSSDIDRAVSAARKAFQEWRKLPPQARKAQLFQLADQIEQEKHSLALMDSLEMGMPITRALEQVDIVTGLFRYNAELIDKLYGEIAPSDTATTLALSQPEPSGVIGIISPWNYPLWSAVLAIAPALAAGNTVVVKPSEQTPSSTLKLAEIAAQAGLPAGVLNVVPGLGLTAGAALASHNDVDKLHFTGSTQVGRQMMIYAGQSNGKSLMLEMGGKSPQIVFEDAADLPKLGAWLAESAFYNSGQLCVAKTRLLVHENIKDQILASIQEQTHQVIRIGDPLDEQTTMGPIASRRQFDRVASYVKAGQEQGAEMQTLTTAGAMPSATAALSNKESSACYMQPTLFTNVDNRMRIAQEEIFGPVLSMITFKTEDEAIQLANDVSYGLSAIAWTGDLRRVRRLARELDVGSLELRATTAPAADASGLSREPHGASGFGIVGGLAGLRQYIRLKGVQIITD